MNAPLAHPQAEPFGILKNPSDDANVKNPIIPIKKDPLATEPWRQAAAEYHKERAGRANIAWDLDRDRKEIARIRHLLSPEVSFDRAWHELNSTRSVLARPSAPLRHS